MPKPHTHAELDQARLDRGRRRFGADPQPRGGPPHHRGIADRLGRGDQQQPPGLVRKSLHPPTEVLFDAAGQSHQRWEAQIRQLAPAESIPEAIPATPAGCRESRRGSDRAPAYRAVQSAQNPAALARLPPAAPRSSAPPTPPARCSVSGPRRPCQPIPPPNGAQRTQGLAQRRDRATARHRPNTQEAAPRRPRTAGSAPPARPKTGRVPARNSCRRQCRTASRCGAGKRCRLSSMGAHS